MFDNLKGYAALPLRLILGIGMVYHGWPKIFSSEGHDGFVGMLRDMIGVPFPELMAYVVGLVELFGGLALIAGAFVALVSIPLIINMLVAMFTFHLPNGFNFMNQPPGVEVNLLYIAGLLALIFMGAGALSVDEMRKGKTSETAT